MRLVGAGVVIAVIGIGMLGRTVSQWLGHPAAVSSTSGDRVLRLADGSLGGFEPFALGAEPAVLAVGLAVVAAGLVVRAARRAG